MVSLYYGIAEEISYASVLLVMIGCGKAGLYISTGHDCACDLRVASVVMVPGVQAKWSCESRVKVHCNECCGSADIRN
eukprot:6195421-Pleurochrysis_carterae.AAC.2